MNDTPHPSGERPPRPRPAAVRWLETAELAVGTVLLTLVFLLMLTQALQRHLPVPGWGWTAELARFGLVWLTFSLAGYLVGRDEHVTVKLVDLLPRPGIRRAVWAVANLVVAAVCLAFTAEAAHLVFSGSPQATPSLGIPLAWVYVIPMAGLALAALRAVANVFAPGPANPEGTAADREEAPR